jgi:hypothetical protein
MDSFEQILFGWYGSYDPPCGRFKSADAPIALAMLSLGTRRPVFPD